MVFNYKGAYMIQGKYGRLSVIQSLTKRRFLCKCDCGKIIEISKILLLSGKRKSCGCKTGRPKKYKTKYPSWVPLSIEYRTWRAMKGRCLSPSHERYDSYGGRGIDVCPEWINSFMSFFEDMGVRPSPEYSLDRIDNDKGYYKDNCRWGTSGDQSLNKRDTLYLEHNNLKLPLKEWATKLSIPYSRLFYRFKRGMTATQILKL